jgi:hypothetical protein
LAMNSVKTAQLAHSGHLLIWVAIPCTGGCPWHRVNKRYVSARVKIAKSRNLFLKLWENCSKVIKYALDSGGAMIGIEWPQQCDYWSDPIVLDFLKTHGLERFTTTVVCTV